MSVNTGKVFMIGWEYPPHNSGGLGVACQGLTEALSGANQQIYFTLPYALDQNPGHMQVLSCYDKTMAAVNGANKAPFSVYSTISNAGILGKKIDASELNALPTSELERSVEHYAKLVNQSAKKLNYDFDVIHAHDWMSFPAARQLKKNSGKPMLAHVHSTEFDRIPSGYGSHYITHTEYEGMQAADRVIAVSFYTKQLLVKKYHIDPKKISVVHNGLLKTKFDPDPGRHHFASKRPVVAFMGRLTMQKGANYFIEVASKVIKTIPDALFVLAGSGDMYYELLIKAAGSQLTSNVLFSGFVRDKQKDKLLDRADVFVMPSLSEPFGLMAMEAAQHHTPVIISKNTGVSEVMKHSIAIDFWDANKMAQSIISILEDKGYSQEIVDGQLNDLKQATWQQSANKLRKIYSKV